MFFACFVKKKFNLEIVLSLSSFQCMATVAALTFEKAADICLC